jgi:hypothetical protein
MRHVTNTQEGASSSILVRPRSSELRDHASSSTILLGNDRGASAGLALAGWGLPRSGRSPETAL